VICATDPLRQGALGHQERPGDLRGAQPADRPQRQRDLRGRGQRGMTAQEQQRQGVVGGRGIAVRAHRVGLQRRGAGLAAAARGVAA
jgi:hypothetical protein